MKPVHRRDLLIDGASDQAIAAAVARGDLQRIRRGSYIAPETWRGLHADDRERALALAAHDAARQPPVFSYTTAAALHGLPLFDHRPERAHVMSPSMSSAGSNRAVLRHRDRWDGEAVDLGELRATTLARTVFDVARTSERTTGVACADAAVRKAAARGPDGADQLRDDLRRLVVDNPRAPGIRRARFITEFMDPRPDSAGESVSRLHLHDLGFRHVRLQVTVVVAGGRRFLVDFDIDGVLGEFDGAVKYVDRAMRQGRTPQQVVLDEKRREDAIRAATGRRLIRWGMREVASRDRFRRFLTGVGVTSR